MLHYQIQFSVSFLAGGPSMYCVRWSNEAATVHADITADHRDVPANLLTSLLEWDVANPRTTLPTSTICFFLYLSSVNQFTALRSILIGELQSISELIALLSYPFWPGVRFCFARTIHSKSTIRKAFPNKCVCVCFGDDDVDDRDDDDVDDSDDDYDHRDDDGDADNGD